MSWLSRTPSMETSSFNRVPGTPTDSMGPPCREETARKNANCRWITSANLLKWQQSEQYPVQDVRSMDRIVHDSLAIHLNLHLRDASRQHRVGGVEIDRPDHSANNNGLIFRVHVQLLGAFNHQVAVHQHMRDPRRHRRRQSGLAAGGSFAI